MVIFGNHVVALNFDIDPLISNVAIDIASTAQVRYTLTSFVRLSVVRRNEELSVSSFGFNR